MASFIVRPIDTDTAAEVRRTMRAPEYGHAVHHEVARGTGPCRVCLNPFQVGQEERLLFTFNPFGGSQRLAQPGPVFIHADACEPARADVYPDGLRELPVIAEVHYSDRSVSALHAMMVGSEAETLEALLALPNVSFVHLRHAEAGCFIARVERA